VSVDGPLTTRDDPLAARRRGRAIKELASRQHGVVALRQLRALGLSASGARKWVTTGRLHRVHREVYAVGHSALKREGHFMAAVLSCGPGAVLSHGSAAAHWGIRDSAAGFVDVTDPARLGRSRPGLRVHRGDRMRSDETTTEDGIPCTTVARTLLDLAVVLDHRGIERECERSVRLRLFDLGALGSLLERHRGRRGVARLRTTIADYEPDLLLTRSELEARFLRLCIRSGLPRPVVNGRLELAGSVLEVDFHWPRQRLVVETDGASVHGTVKARETDTRRDQMLTAAGWTVIRSTWRQVTAEPHGLLATLTTLLTGDRRPTGR
jgi:Transcriptional regulator, AbiEi antitoxin/Protein of unknown function (DUF559)